MYKVIFLYIAKTLVLLRICFILELYNEQNSNQSHVNIFVSWDFGIYITQVDELLKQRDSIQASFTVTRAPNGNGVNLSNGSTSKIPGETESPLEDGNSDGKDKSGRKKWFNLNLKGSDKKLG